MWLCWCIYIYIYIYIYILYYIILYYIILYYIILYILVKGTITDAWVAAPAPADNAGKEVVFKNCAPGFCISEINNTLIDNVKEIDIV